MDGILVEQRLPRARTQQMLGGVDHVCVLEVRQNPTLHFTLKSMNEKSVSYERISGSERLRGESGNKFRK